MSAIVINLIKQNLHPTRLSRGVGKEYDALLDAIGDARVVMLGAQTHGTQQFYSHRAEITRTLIEKKGFNCVTVEADWPDAYHINQYVKGHGDPSQVGSRSILVNFKRHPLWMWRNEVMQDFVHWLRAYNDAHSDILPKRERLPIGFYGLDLFSFYGSMHEVISKLKKTHRDTGARILEQKYSVFDNYRDDQSDMPAPTNGARKAFTEAAEALQMLQMERYKLTHEFGIKIDEEQFWDIEQNARLVKDAEAFYRLIYTNPVQAWNLRDRHMANTLKELAEHLSTRRKQSKIVVWQHNMHAGDGRYTGMHEKGEVNMGMLVRQHFGIENTFNVGFTTYQGKILAANDWNEEAKVMDLPPACEGSYAEVFHKVGLPAYYVILRSNDLMHPASQPLAEVLKGPKLERSIGTVYWPEAESERHYVKADISKQFDCVFHLDQTIALQPLEEVADSPVRGNLKPELAQFTM